MKDKKIRKIPIANMKIYRINSCVKLFIPYVLFLNRFNIFLLISPLTYPR